MARSKPLRLWVISDLHVDHLENRRRLPGIVEAMRQHEADGLVVAGDVSHRFDQVEAALLEFAVLEGPKFFVAGNHDIWIVRDHHDNARDSWEKLQRITEVCRRAGFHDLEAASARLGGFTLVGSMGWYDYSFAAPSLGLTDADYAKKQFEERTYMDRDYARWNATDAQVVGRLLAPLEQRLARAESPVIFVSHHVPRKEWVLRRGFASWDAFNAYMGSARTEEALARRGVTRFLFGHTHRPITLIEPGRCVINNPLGYPSQALTPTVAPFEIT